MLTYDFMELPYKMIIIIFKIYNQYILIIEFDSFIVIFLLIYFHEYFIYASKNEKQGKLQKITNIKKRIKSGINQVKNIQIR